MKQSENIDELTKALVKAQKAMKAAEINADNPFYKSKYADLPAVCRASKGPLADNGLAIMQGCDFLVSEVTGEPIEFMTTMLSHSSGQWIQTKQVIKPVKPGGQERGKEITYARRYALLSIINNYAVGDPDLDAETIQGDDKVKKEAARKVGEKKVNRIIDKKLAEQKDIPLGDVPTTSGLVDFVDSDKRVDLLVAIEDKLKEDWPKVFWKDWVNDHCIKTYGVAKEIDYATNYQYNVDTFSVDRLEKVWAYIKEGK